MKKDCKIKLSFHKQICFPCYYCWLVRNICPTQLLQCGTPTLSNFQSSKDSFVQKQKQPGYFKGQASGLKNFALLSRKIFLLTLSPQWPSVVADDSQPQDECDKGNRMLKKYFLGLQKMRSPPQPCVRQGADSRKLTEEAPYLSALWGGFNNQKILPRIAAMKTCKNKSTFLHKGRFQQSWRWTVYRGVQWQVKGEWL